MAMMRIRGVWTANLTAFLLGAGMYSAFIVFPQFAQLPKSTGFGFGASVVESGLYLLPSTIAMMLVGMAAGPSPRGSARKSAAVVGSVFTAAAFGLTRGRPRPPLRHAAQLGADGGRDRPRFRRARQPRRRRPSPRTRRASAGGMNTVMRTIGGALGGQLSATLIAAQHRRRRAPGRHGLHGDVRDGDGLPGRVRIRSAADPVGARGAQAGVRARRRLTGYRVGRPGCGCPPGAAAGAPSVVRSGTSLSSHESTNGTIAIAMPQRKTPCSACANACRKSAWTAGGRCLACVGVEVDAAAQAAP